MDVMIRSCWKRCDPSAMRLVAIRQVSHAVIVNGPGFHWARIAVSFVHALDLVRPLRVLPIDQLSLLGYTAKSSEGAIVDARMGEVYVGTKKHSDGTYQSLGLLPLTELNSDQTWVCHADEAHRFDAKLILGTDSESLRSGISD